MKFCSFITALEGHILESDSPEILGSTHCEPHSVVNTGGAVLHGAANHLPSWSLQSRDGIRRWVSRQMYQWDCLDAVKCYERIRQYNAR